ncbi:MAG: L-2-hydroxyglutarate oxidase [Fidelibacterota bacterium]
MQKIVIIGGGIVGLATGLQLRNSHPDIKLTILEKEPDLARHQTGHNSGVIHSGIYYRPGSLKARNCREGVRLLIEFCDREKIPYEMCGKVIVATSEEEVSRLEALYERGRANQVPELRLISPEELKEMEPHTVGVKALVSPQTGIVDYTAVARTMAQVIESSGGVIRRSAPVTGLRRDGSGFTVETAAGDFYADRVINCAGLYADRIPALAGQDRPLRIIPFRGEYYTLAEQSRGLVRNLIYPVPDPAFPFLGVHFTRGIDGEVEAGPNAVLALAREGYRKSDFRLSEVWDYLSYGGFWHLAWKYWRVGISEQYRSLLKPVFVRSLQKLIPEITADDLAPGGAGVRAQALEPDGSLTDDFRIVRQGNLIHVLNAPSPAATSSLAIGRRIVREVLTED